MVIRGLTLLMGIALFNISTAFAVPLTLAGDEIDAAIIRNTDGGYGYALGRITGYGLDNPFTVQNGATDTKEYIGTFALNVDADQFAIKYLSSAGWQDGISFKLSDLDFIPNGYLIGLTVDTNLAGYTLNFGSDFVEINWGNTRFTNETYFIGKFVTTAIAAVPEPETYAMLLAGLGLVGFQARRRI